MIPVAAESEEHYVLSADQRLEKLLARSSAERGQPKTHKVKPGESWWKIAAVYGVSQSQLAKWNGKATGDLIRPGDTLVVWPDSAGSSGRETRSVTRKVAYKVRSGDNLSRIANKFSVGVDQLVAWNNIDRTKYLQPGDHLSIHVDVANR